MVIPVAGPESPRSTGALTWLLAASVALLAASCAHGNDLLVSAQGSFRERDFDRALKRYRTLGEEECRREGNRRLCCEGLVGEAETLQALQERQTALKAFERARQECPTDLEVRRRLFLAEHASDPEPDPATVNVAYTVEYVLLGLGENERVQWAGLFLDGQLIGHEPLTVHKGTHELEAELLLEAPGPTQSGARSPVRLRSRQPILVPGPVHLRLTLAERAGASLAEDRLTLEVEAKTESERAALARFPTPDDPAIASKLTIDLRVSGSEPKFPRDLARHGAGWKIPTRICVGPEGRVRSVEFLENAPAREPRVDAIILETVRRWRYGAYKVDNILTGFCHPHEIDLARH